MARRRRVVSSESDNSSSSDSESSKIPSKAVTVSPASVRASKRRAVLSDDVDLQCLICQELVVDATQTMCCGALHCRSCVSRCKTCPNCRKPLSLDKIIPDVRSERLSAARLRMCPYAVDGCTFEGNRSSVAIHEQQCDFVPRSVLRKKIEELNIVIAAKDTEIQRANKAAQETVKQQELMLCALGPDPAISALRVLYGLAKSSGNPHVMKRGTNSESGFEYKQNYDQVIRGVDLRVQVRMVEKNHNVAVFFGRHSSKPFDPSFFKQGCSIQIQLLHPHDTKKAKVTEWFDLTKLNTIEEGGFPNFMTSTELDTYCVNGCIYWLLLFIQI